MPTPKVPLVPASREVRGAVYGSQDPVPFAREVWPSLRPGTRVLAGLDVHKRGEPIEIDCKVAEATASSITFWRKDLRKDYVVSYDQVAYIKWHPAETGEGLEA